MMQSTHMKHQSHYRPLAELNLIDNFLFQEMVSHEETGEIFCRILLSTILGRRIRNVHVVPQKNILGIDTTQHGIRMDAYIEAVVDEAPLPECAAIASEPALDADISPTIYDIEPNKRYEKKTLPRRMRYYHGLIDTRLLSSNMDYERLPQVVIITILPYDPFGCNRMVYTIRNQCVEDPSIPYDDGAMKIFLYTRGTEGNPSQELSDMLRYIEDTNDGNVTNQNIATVSSLVNKVKQSKEVNVSYMKSWEWEKMIREDAIREGLAEGRQAGLKEGRQAGLKEGIAEGLAEGRQAGLKEGIVALIELCRDLKLSNEDTCSQLIQKFKLSSEEAATYMQKYWK